MNDYKFGNKIYELRKHADLSQAEIAKMLGVTNKAVSKWETGKSKPSTDVLKKLSEIFNISMDELLFDMQKKLDKRIEKIVITGGPCAGKSTAMNRIDAVFTKIGYTVLFVPETATELITGGVAPWTCSTNDEYQKCQMELQIAKETVYEQAAHTMVNDKILIVCDRGMLDNKAYMTDWEFHRILNECGFNETELRDGYDAVFHLVTAAKGAAEFYTLSNNAARTETPEEAVAIDNKLIEAWTGHPHLRIIDNSSDFNDKINRLISEKSSFLGEPEPLEIERKFLIEYPDINQFEKNPHCQKVEIIQTYLKSDNDEVRIRQRGLDGNYIYFKTTKREISGLKRVEVERRLTQKEYLELMMQADTSKKQIRKTRYCLAYENQYFEIDIYPFWNDKAIMEIELRSETEAVTFPDFIEVIKEVTDDEVYKNVSIAKHGGCL